MTTSLSPRRRLALAIAAGLVALLALAAAVMLATSADGAPSSFAASDGELRWDATGHATVTISSPSAAECGGAPCAVLTDADGAPEPSGPCVAVAAGGPSVRCATDGLRRLRIGGLPDQIGSANQPFAVTVERAADQPCPAYELTIVQRASSGPVRARDGCRQVIECGSYLGPVDADGRDQVSETCPRVTVDGTIVRQPAGQTGCSTPGNGCAPDSPRGTGQGSPAPVRPAPRDTSGPSGKTPSGVPLISAVRLERAGRRSLRARFSLGQQAQISAVLFRRTPKGGWKRVASLPRPGRLGANQVLFRSGSRARLAAGTYRTTVVIALPDGKPVSSRAIRKR